MACLGAIEQLGWPLDRIVTADVWATDTIQADLPPMVEFKAKADEIIKERWGIEVEHYHSKWTFESGFYCKVSDKGKPKFAGGIRGWPIRLGQWCNRDLKLPALRDANKDSGTYYLGIAADEPNRFHNLTDTKNLHWLRQVGQRPIAAGGARTATYFHPSTRQRRAADVGFAIIKVFNS